MQRNEAVAKHLQMLCSAGEQSIRTVLFFDGHGQRNSWFDHARDFLGLRCPKNWNASRVKTQLLVASSGSVDSMHPVLRHIVTIHRPEKNCCCIPPLVFWVESQRKLLFKRKNSLKSSLLLHGPNLVVQLAQNCSHAWRQIPTLQLGAFKKRDSERQLCVSGVDQNTFHRVYHTEQGTRPQINITFACLKLPTVWSWFLHWGTYEAGLAVLQSPHKDLNHMTVNRMDWTAQDALRN